METTAPPPKKPDHIVVSEVIDRLYSLNCLIETIRAASKHYMDEPARVNGTPQALEICYDISGECIDALEMTGMKNPASYKQDADCVARDNWQDEVRGLAYSGGAKP